MGTENYENDRDHGHDHDDGKDHDHHDKCWKYKNERDEYKKERDDYKKERDEYKKERDEWRSAAGQYKKERDGYKDYLKAALERFGFAVRKLDHLVEDLIDGSKKIGKDHDKEKAWD